MNIQFYAFVTTNEDSPRKANYMKHAKFLDMSIRLNQPNGYLACMHGEAHDDIFLHRIAGFGNLLEATSDPCVYIDADTVVMKPIDDLFDGTFDIAVGYRWGNGLDACVASVILFSGRDRAEEIKFVRKWYVRANAAFETEKWFYDQCSFNYMIGPPKIQRTQNEYENFVTYEPTIKAGIKYLDSFQISCPYTSGIPQDVRILSLHHNVINSKVPRFPWEKE